MHLLKFSNVSFYDKQVAATLVTTRTSTTSLSDSFQVSSPFNLILTHDVWIVFLNSIEVDQLLLTKNTLHVFDIDSIFNLCISGCVDSSAQDSSVSRVGFVLVNISIVEMIIMELSFDLDENKGRVNCHFTV